MNDNHTHQLFVDFTIDGFPTYCLECDTQFDFKNRPKGSAIVKCIVDEKYMSRIREAH